AVNYVQVTGAATGARPTISMQGSDSNIDLGLQTKGTGEFIFKNGAGGIAFGITSTNANPTNLISAKGVGSGSAPSISAVGTDTNIDLAVTPKGTGALVAQASDGGVTINARGANAVDLSTNRANPINVASGAFSVITGGQSNTSAYFNTFVGAGVYNLSNGTYSSVVGGFGNIANGYASVSVSGNSNTASGYYGFIGSGFTNSTTSSTAVTTQSGTMNGTTAVTLSGSNASIKVGQYITGTSIAGDTYVAAISGTSLTLSKNASGSSTSTLSFYTPHGVVVGGGNNQATGSYSFIGGGGDAGTAGNRNVASGDYSVVTGGWKNVASGNGSFIGGGGYLSGSAYGNTASGQNAIVVGGIQNTTSGQPSFIGGGYNNTANGVNSVIVGSNNGTTRSIDGFNAFPASNGPIAGASGVQQSGLLILGRQTTDATATVLTSNSSAAGTTNQVILPNNSAYFVRGTIIAGVTGAGNTSSWDFKGAIKRGANAASTTLVGAGITANLIAQDAGAATWAVSITADTTNGGLKVTVTGQAATTIRWVCEVETTEMTY
ncbi:MAG: beta strand repeat-containing protein, partial [Fluviibacter sp.]